MKLIEDWRAELRRLWTIRLALFWAAVCGMYGAWPAFMELVPAPVFAIASVVMSMAIVGARILKQPGAGE